MQTPSRNVSTLDRVLRKHFGLTLTMTNKNVDDALRSIYWMTLGTTRGKSKPCRNIEQLELDDNYSKVLGKADSAEEAYSIAIYRLTTICAIRGRDDRIGFLYLPKFTTPAELGMKLDLMDRDSVNDMVETNT